ncbi:MbtH family NRPS accessory protein [Streptomyces sp. NPDC047860]|uniref:MbtH family protein n=1 Tax=Streptomyces sp. NPDC047860 TaxID=3155743 RepID=UPI0033DB7F89
MPEGSPMTWKVVINDEEQYALFPAQLPTPGGWREAGFSGSEDECTVYVDEHWTDMRPRSLREAMDSTTA